MENESAKKKQMPTSENRNNQTSATHDDDHHSSFPDNGADVPHPQQTMSDPTDLTMNMSNMANTLPNYGYRGPQQLYRHPVPTGSNPTMIYQYPTAQYSNTTPGQSSTFIQHSTIQYPAERVYEGYRNNPNMAQPQYSSPMYMTTPAMMPTLMPAQFQNYQQAHAFHHVADGRFTGSGSFLPMHGYGAGHGNQVYPVRSGSDFNSPAPSSTSGQTPSALRGPPRKPRQSGHALWVGNLPPGSNIVDLKDHFARDAREDIESVFLISKSNCAFVNYKTEESCVAAMTRFHDSRFQGVRLVCRLRRGTVSALTSSLPGDSIDVVQSSDLQPETSTTTDGAPRANPLEEEEGSLPRADDVKIQERFFVIKSLTIEDLERSVQTGIWATQSHNEAALNKAYESAANVYLIFSANKSGEYFGYARMDSAIDDESAAQIASESPKVEVKPTADSQLHMSSVLPMTIPTPATAIAPKGHIIDDSARGTIFWEAEQIEFPNDDQALVTGEAEAPAELDQTTMLSDPASIQSDLISSQTTFGKPFKISWQSTDRLPFYRTRGLRNPWNTNREVKIARDGTEIEPTIGRKLVDMFGTQPPLQVRGQPQFQGPLIVGPGFGPGHQGPGVGPGFGRSY